MGYTAIRPNQHKAVKSFIEGTTCSSGCLPTGSEKSLCIFYNTVERPHNIYQSGRQGGVILHEKVKCLNTVVFMPCSSKYNKEVFPASEYSGAITFSNCVFEFKQERSKRHGLFSILQNMLCCTSVFFFSSTLWRKQHRPSGYTVSLQKQVTAANWSSQDKIFVDNTFMSLTPG